MTEPPRVMFDERRSVGYLTVRQRAERVIGWEVVLAVLAGIIYGIAQNPKTAWPEFGEMRSGLGDLASASLEGPALTERR